MLSHLDLAIIIADWCLYFALKVTLESNFRVQMNRDIKFSVHQLYEISKMAEQQFPKQTSAHRLLIKLKDTGLISEDDYKVPTLTLKRSYSLTLKIHLVQFFFQYELYYSFVAILFSPSYKSFLPISCIVHVYILSVLRSTP